jgi:hypothetical protein
MTFISTDEGIVYKKHENVILILKKTFIGINNRFLCRFFERFNFLNSCVVFDVISITKE